MAVTADDIKKLYQEYLGREPLQSGIDAWLATGQSLVKVAAGISQSPEAAVYRAYQQTLGREPEMEERQAWVEEINTTGSIRQAVDAIATSPEAQKTQTGGMLTGTTDTTNAARVEDKTSDTTIKAKQLEGSEFDFTDLFYEQLLPQFTDVGPGYDPSQSDFFGPFALRFIEIIKGYFEDLDNDDIDRIIRQGQVSEFISVLRRFENGDATLDDLKAVDVSDLTEMPGWSDYYSGIIGEGTGEDADTRQKTDQLAGDLNAILGGIIDEQVLSDSLYESFAPGGDMPEPEGSGPTLTVDVWECLTERGGTWDECTSLGVVLQLPGLPEIPSAILGSIFKDVTLKEIKDIVVDAGTTVKNVITGQCDPASEIEDPEGSGNYRCPTITDIVLRKIEEKKDELKDIFDQNCNTFTGEGCGVTAEDVIKTVGGGITKTIWGIILTGAEDKVKSTIGLPVIAVGEDTTCTDGTVYDPDANNGMGGCVESGTTTGFGMCDELDDLGNQVEKLDADGTNCPGVQPDWNPGDPCTTGLDPNVEYDGKLNDQGTCIPNSTPVEFCDDPEAENYDQEGPCTYGPAVTTCQDQAANNYGQEGPCTYGPEVTTCQDTEADNYGQEGDCVYGTTSTGTKEWKSDYCKTRGPEGGTLVTIYTDGSQEESFSENCYEPADSPPPGGDGCQGGKVMNPSTDQCECPEGTVEDATGNCVTPTTTPPPENPEEEEEERSGGGGGGGGGGMMSPFSIRPIGITAQPALVARQQFPITDYLQKGMLTGNGNKLA